MLLQWVEYDAPCRSGCVRLILASRSHLLLAVLFLSLPLSQGGAPSLMADVATYFEDRGELEKAVQLYQRAGDLSRALDLCFRAAAAQVVKCASIVLY